MNTSFLILLGVLALVVFLAVNIYNRLVELKNRLENAFAQIEVQLKRRYDLIPNLLETVKAYLKHESQTLENVVKARNTALSALEAVAKNPASPSSMDAFMRSEKAFQGAMGSLNIAVEAYPDLKASANMQHFSEELTSTENKISFARQAFNDAVTAYNTYKQTFPPVLLAGMFGHAENARMLEFEDAIQEAPKVTF
ncbi:LemA family protein [Sulfurospirillum sp. T05]|uniref:LemA family protein n=1 Tax=Sulfurospirillum tamanense TaxID=2813362 RepID=A0ABS2WSC7_9BACT|nr:LemA family protein [Sulfurospirillum tamanensis]MBN2964572.1 LemA family protein [Sulfurospirillum tamanensis]